jgi:hypothetical protein
MTSKNVKKCQKTSKMALLFEARGTAPARRVGMTFGEMVVFLHTEWLRSRFHFELMVD